LLWKDIFCDFKFISSNKSYSLKFSNFSSFALKFVKWQPCTFPHWGLSESTNSDNRCPTVREG
jgi:hypothetical protein